MSAGPADIANQLAAQPTDGLPAGRGPDGQLPAGAGITPANTGAAQFLSGPLTHGDYRQGITNLGTTPQGMPQDFEGKFGGALSRYVSQQLNPGHIPGRQFSGNRGLLTERIA